MGLYIGFEPGFWAVYRGVCLGWRFWALCFYFSGFVLYGQTRLIFLEPVCSLGFWVFSGIVGFDFWVFGLVVLTVCVSCLRVLYFVVCLFFCWCDINGDLPS